ncbi:DNA-deoxyinosine glycosylase [Candidatus Enterococcus willemsii]
MQTGLAPIYNQATEVLILGSAPSQISLQKQEYYANKGNQFWKTIFQALGVTDPLDYQERVRILLAHKIGLWDVYDTFERKGSMDHHFQQTTINDFSKLLSQAPIKKVIANGKKAAIEIQENHLFTELEVINCLSTSGANNGRAKERLKDWSNALQMSQEAIYFGRDAWLQAAAYHLRYEVFVLEQRIPACWEFDALDLTANYFVLFQQNIPVATIRYQAISPDIIQPDRFCVAHSYRKQGFGTRLLKVFEEKAFQEGYRYAQLSAEIDAVAFYQKVGYQICSDSFEEDGILCIQMKKTLVMTSF